MKYTCKMLYSCSVLSFSNFDFDFLGAVSFEKVPLAAHRSGE